SVSLQQLHVWFQKLVELNSLKIHGALPFGKTRQWERIPSMSTSPQRSLQVEEHSRAPLKAPFKATIRSNGSGRVRLNGKSHIASNGNGRGRTTRNGNASPNGNGHGRPASNRHANGMGGSGASRNRPKTRVFVAAENRLLREALSRMLTKNGDIEVITGEAAE